MVCVKFVFNSLFVTRFFCVGLKCAGEHKPRRLGVYGLWFMVCGLFAVFDSKERVHGITNHNPIQAFNIYMSMQSVSAQDDTFCLTRY